MNYRFPYTIIDAFSFAAFHFHNEFRIQNIGVL